MILFEKDWERFPHAIVDTKTTNESFVRYASLLKGMGVKNHLFPLQLHNRELVGIDPHNPNLGYEEQLAIAMECKTNFFYFIREIARAPGGTDDDPIRFRANRGNMALFWLFFNHITTILIQIRQTGKSFSTDILMTYLMHLRCRMTEFNLLTKDDTLRAANLARLKNISLELPFYLCPRDRNDVGNTEEMTVKAHSNIYRGHLPNKSPKLAYNVGRGLTSPIFQIDEAAFFFNIAISLPAALAAGTAARDRARARNEPYGTILTTTAGKKDDRDGAYVFNMLQHSAVWSEKFFDALSEEDLRILIAANTPAEPGKREKNVRVNCTFNHRQLGYTDEWLKRAIMDAEAEGEDADRDFGNVWTAGSTSSPLTVEQAELVRSSEASEVTHERQGAYPYIIRWQMPENNVAGFMANNTTIMSLDTSDASGGDDIGMVLRDTVTGGTIAAGNYNETNLIFFAQWLVSVMVKYPKMTVIIERRSTGSSIIDYLLLMLPEHGIDPFKRVFNWVVQHHDEKPEQYKAIKSKHSNPSQETITALKKHFGFSTSASGVTSRTGLYNGLKAGVKLCGSMVRDKPLINQMLSLVQTNGRIDHPPGGRDDMCIAWCLGQWFLTHGKNLEHYGINPRTVLEKNDTIVVNSDPVAQYDQMYQDKIKQEIEYMLGMLSNEKDEFMCWRLENRLKQLTNDLNETNRVTMAVDDLIAGIRETRRSPRANYGGYGGGSRGSYVMNYR